MDKLDSRVIDPSKRGSVPTPWGPASRVYCVNCHRRGGIITEQWASVVIWLCDDCFYTHGHLTGFQEVEEETCKQFLKAEEIK